MGIMVSRNACSAKLILFLLALAVLAGFQSGFSETQDIGQLRKAAMQGDVDAQFDLGIMYYLGEGVPEDDREAVKWLRKAAEEGLAPAQSQLGLMYYNGAGVPEDYVKAYVWLNLAAAQGNTKATEGKDSLRNRMTAEQVAEAQKLATELWGLIESSKSK